MPALWNPAFEVGGQLVQMPRGRRRGCRTIVGVKRIDGAPLKWNDLSRSLVAFDQNNYRPIKSPVLENAAWKRLGRLAS
jgi:hypothetical protein